jgi:4-hydroxy 2-oxovalerate aldolase
MYRPQIKVIDCTVRDGGLMNKWQFDDTFVRNVYQSLAEAGVDYRVDKAHVRIHQCDSY